MALLQTQFYNQISLATIKKSVKDIGDKVEFWEADVLFNMNKSDFSFNIIEPSMNTVTKLHKNNFKFENPVNGESLGIKRFLTKEEAENFVLFNIIQIYKPLKNFVSENDIEQKFNTILEKHPEKILKELESGKSWLTN